MSEALNLLRSLNESVLQPDLTELGEKVIRNDIPSCVKPFLTFPEYEVNYPDRVTEQVLALAGEYNRHFSKLVEEAKNAETDYMHCYSPEADCYVNYFFQIDMRALPQKFLDTLATYDEATINQVLRRTVFEYEDSLAMNQLLRQCIPLADGTSVFAQGYDRIMDGIRRTYNMPIALLATTDEKVASIKAMELGIDPAQVASDELVRNLLGYDTLMGPNDLLQHLEANNGNSEYLLYVRSSFPVENLKKPDAEVPKTILDDEKIKHIIKKYSITLNLDALRDTKRAMLDMGQGICINRSNYDEVIASNAIEDLLMDSGIAMSDETVLRLKPMDGVFGCYGHYSLPIKHIRGGKRKNKLRKEMQKRGDYLLQVELPIYTLADIDNQNQHYHAIHRNFVGYNPETAQYEAVYGMMNMMSGAYDGKVHGGRTAHFAGINLK